MWDETARLDTVAPAGQMEAAEDDTLPAIPEFNIPPRKIKKYAHEWRLNTACSLTTCLQGRPCCLSELCHLPHARGLGRRRNHVQSEPLVQIEWRRDLVQSFQWVPGNSREQSFRFQLTFLVQNIIRGTPVPAVALVEHLRPMRALQSCRQSCRDLTLCCRILSRNMSHWRR
jgi:hypothetical protein